MRGLEHFPSRQLSSSPSISSISSDRRLKVSRAPTLQEHLQELIQDACSEERTEPDVNLILELCEIVKSKTLHAHLAATALSEYFAKEDKVQTMIALFVLDMLVINCGYPMRLAVNKRDFLNKLVYRFPPTPQHRMDKTHEQVLYLIHKWCLALCEQSKYRTDFGNIRLMHSLLKSKHFKFPHVDSAEVQAIIAGEEPNALRTPEELAEEQRIVQEAKLEDLLRRGTPSDLKAANELMKVMSGYVRSESKYSTVDATVTNSIRGLEEKRKLLEELLWNTRKEQYVTNEAISSLIDEFRQSQPKLHKLALSSLPESIIDRVIRLIDDTNNLLRAFDDAISTGSSLSSSGTSPRLSNPTHGAKKDPFSLIDLADGLQEECCQGSVLLLDGADERSFTNEASSFKPVASLTGPGINVEVYTINQTRVIMTLLNFSPEAQHDAKLKFESHPTIEVGVLPSMQSHTIVLDGAERVTAGPAIFSFRKSNNDGTTDFAVSLNCEKR